MNVLLFVTTLILVMGMLTYARLETYRSFSITQAGFDRYMQSSERAVVNDSAVWWYDHSKGSSKALSTTPKNKASKKSSARLSFRIFTDTTKRDSDPTVYLQLEALAAKLIRLLYHDYPFYREMEQKQHDFVDFILKEGIPKAVAALPDKEKPTRASDLANLNFGDNDLNLVFYKILNGTREIPISELQREAAVAAAANAMLTPEERGEEVNEDTGESGPQDEYRSPPGYLSLLDLITMKDATTIRVYLAPREILLALFDDPNVVDEIMQARRTLYQQVLRNQIPPDQATSQFETQYVSRVVQPFDKTILDFTVNKTNPALYESLP